MRYVPTCIVNHSIVKPIDSIIDTGAMFTCYFAKVLDKNLTENLFENSEYKIISGFVDTQINSKFYKYKVKQFTIGNIDLGSQVIWITFDNRITDNIVGMDILSQVTFLQYANTNIMYFFKDKKELDTFVSDVIIRKCYKCNNGMLSVVLSHTYFYFTPNNIKKDNNGSYIMIGKQKCYLIL